MPVSTLPPAAATRGQWSSSRRLTRRRCSHCTGARSGGPDRRLGPRDIGLRSGTTGHRPHTVMVACAASRTWLLSDFGGVGARDPLSVSPATRRHRPRARGRRPCVSPGPLRRGRRRGVVATPGGFADLDFVRCSGSSWACRSASAFGADRGGVGRKQRSRSPMTERCKSLAGDNAVHADVALDRDGEGLRQRHGRMSYPTPFPPAILNIRRGGGLAASPLCRFTRP